MSRTIKTPTREKHMKSDILTFRRGGSSLILAAAFALTAAGCHGSVATQPDTATAAAKSGPVPVGSPERKSLRRVIEQPGTVQAYEEAHLFARVPGYVRLPLGEDGQIVSDIGHKIRGPKRDESG